MRWIFLEMLLMLLMLLMLEMLLKRMTDKRCVRLDSVKPEL